MPRACNKFAGGSYFLLQCSHNFLTNRCAKIAVTDDAIKNGSMPISIKRVIVAGALLV